MRVCDHVSSWRKGLPTLGWRWTMCRSWLHSQWLCLTLVVPAVQNWRWTMCRSWLHRQWLCLTLVVPAVQDCCRTGGGSTSSCWIS